MSGARRLGRYIVGERLGSGGLGEVYLAHAEGARGFRKRVVVKQIRRELAARPEVAALLLAEAEVVQRLAHGNIVQVLDYGVDERAPYLVMEHVDGASLAELLHDLQRRGAPLGVAAALFVVESVCAALAHAHAARDVDERPLGLVHRDVTPANILISRDGVVKLTDFGIASLTAVGDAAPGTGTPGYAAPEQLAGAAVDARADLYALGVVFAELLTRCPGDTGDLREIAAQASAEAPTLRHPDANTLAAALETWRAHHHILRAPAELAACVRDLQRRRGQVADQLGAALEQRVRPPRTAALPPRRAPARTARWAGLALAAIALTSAATYAALSDRDTLAETTNISAERPATQTTHIPAAPPTQTTHIPADPAAPPAQTTHIPADPAVPPTQTTHIPADLAQTTHIPADPAQTTHIPTDPAPPAQTTPIPTNDLQPAGTAPARPRPAPTGRLLVNLVPWAEVSVDGRPLGRTPLVAELAPGRHRLVLVNPELGQRRSRDVSITRAADTRIIDW